MCRNHLRYLVAVSCGLFGCTSSLLAEETPSVEEWQIKGILAALKDEYPEVRRNARWKLSEFFRAPEKAWNGKSRDLAREAVPELLLTLEDRRRERQGPNVAHGSVDFDRSK